MKGVCKMCDRETNRLDTHHVVPKFLGGDDKDLVYLCQHCHGKADGRFKKFLLNPFGENDYGVWHKHSFSDIGKRKELIYKQYSKCAMCDKKVENFLSGHHVMPRFLGGTDEDIILVCRNCHSRADKIFLQYLLDPFGENGYGIFWRNPIQKKKRDAEYYQEKKKKIKQQVKKYRVGHREEIKEKIRKYRHTSRGKETINKASRKYYWSHLEQERERSYKYRRSHKTEKHRYYLKRKEEIRMRNAKKVT